MGIDVLRYIGAVARSVETRLHQGKPARVVKASCAYDTGIEDLWDAITNAERLPRWLLPVSGDLRLGGRYQLEGNASGRITACDPPDGVPEKAAKAQADRTVAFNTGTGKSSS